jgi:Lon protease-like protein
MAGFEDLSFSVEKFAGQARLFPLPNLVLFPHVMQPLHVFEPRYREMLEDALAGDGLIATALLAPGWQPDYDGRPPLRPMACLGRITSHHRLQDGTYNVLLLGLCRVRLLDELTPAKSFREAKVEICADCYPPEQAAELPALRRRLRQAFLKIIPMLPEAQEQLDQLLGSSLPLGILTDVIGYMLDIDIAAKQALLAECNVHRRAELLLGHLYVAAGQETGKGGLGAFPPQFSVN